MEFTAAQDYAIRMVLYLSCILLSKGKIIASREEICQQMGIPKAFLAKLAQFLEKKGILAIKRGKNGGYLLVKNPAEISLLEVVEAFEGPITFARCFVKKEQCNRISFCPVNKVLQEINQCFREKLSSYTFDKLAKAELMLYQEKQQEKR
ncbi:Rrf2 family transcriptional regulator [Thermodesulfobacterium sp. TA1]|uniref:RrF2 family transcriptional regulator n=1 Tax=Thermodesulfobacterium sp. TA1 TaxID=2234087 RepID=UPI0012325DCA|nr:Rrf2 family transcriptional regulator [Thermodesulfobacterium sp. TA1]QER42090.1 Rrf2 family transcriptional regulator [Thermodesulfobacterium sp. TA1]